ncbi:virulence protein SciE type [Paraburkholderia sp. UCT31]|uniref:type VI secretion system accessory protein TagJ n=1 Tax=Paraburkholderia sp. UCT31 TaxID=2615209 RepID=UPI001654EEEA|nr:type VI secretion system accessory protein TagJ [Paraburkholderia sp. UCT31]MBC8735905.1 virulence protein SciE type [Paraburkholderia sp. UCT31]
MTLSSVDVKPEKLLADGHLNDALQALAAKVKNSPADATLRVFLFQLLALRGDWERAGTQLTVAGELERQNALMVAAYRAALVGEREREAVLAALRNPATVGERSEWERLLLQSLQQLCGGRIAEALALRARAFDEAETVRGSIDGVPFKWIADADPRFGPCLEVILKDSYAWVPFSRVAALSFDAPTDLRDKIWAPVRITWKSGDEAIGFVPCRYCGSERGEDVALALAKRTAWTDLGDGCFVGVGQRMLITDVDEYPLLDVRSITFETA